MKFWITEEDSGPVLFSETLTAEHYTFRVVQQSNVFQTMSSSGQRRDRVVTFLCTTGGTGLTQREKLPLKVAAS